MPQSFHLFSNLQQSYQTLFWLCQSFWLLPTYAPKFSPFPRVTPKLSKFALVMLLLSNSFLYVDSPLFAKLLPSFLAFAPLLFLSYQLLGTLMPQLSTFSQTYVENFHFSPHCAKLITFSIPFAQGINFCPDYAPIIEFISVTPKLCTSPQPILPFSHCFLFC